MLIVSFLALWPLMELLTVYLVATGNCRNHQMAVSEQTSRTVYMGTDMTGVLCPQAYKICMAMSTATGEVCLTRHHYLPVQPSDMYGSLRPHFHRQPYASLRLQPQALPIDILAILQMMVN
jgi:hypothetical protein